MAPTKPAGALATTAIALTAAYTASTVLSAVMAPGTVERTRDQLANPNDVDPTAGLADSALSGLQSLIAIASFVFLALWMMRIRTNLAAVGRPAGGPPAVEWWGWFVPLANFVLPYLGMRAISRRSVSTGLLLGWWLPFCAVWLVGPVAASATFRAIDFSTGEVTHPEVLDQLVPLSWASASLLLVSWLFLVLVIRRTTARHLEAAAG